MIGAGESSLNNPKSRITSILNIVDGVTGNLKNGESFSDKLEEAILLEVDRRARDTVRAEKLGVLPARQTSTIFSEAVDNANHEIAEIRSQIDGRPAAEHLAKIAEEDAKPDIGFFASLARDSRSEIDRIKRQIDKEKGVSQQEPQDREAARGAQGAKAPAQEEHKGLFASAVSEQEAKIAELKAQIAAQNKDSSPEMGEHQRDDLQQAKTKAKAVEKDHEMTAQQKAEMTREKIRVTELKLQAYRSLSKILKGRISDIEESIKNGEPISGDDLGKLNKFKDAVDKFSEKTAILEKSKEGLNKEQQENLKQQKVAKFKELEQKMKAKRKELDSAARAEREAADSKNYAGFVLPGDFLKIVQEEQEQMAAARSDALEAEVSSLASEIENVSKGGSSAGMEGAAMSSAQSAAINEASSGKEAISRAKSVDVSKIPEGANVSSERSNFQTPEASPVDSVPTSAPEAGAGSVQNSTPDKSASAEPQKQSMEETLFSPSNVEVSQASSAPPPKTPVTQEVQERKAREAKEFDPGAYSKKEKGTQ